MVFKLEILYSFLLLLSCAIGISINIGHVEFFQKSTKNLSLRIRDVFLTDAGLYIALAVIAITSILQLEQFTKVCINFCLMPFIWMNIFCSDKFGGTYREVSCEDE